MKRLTLLTVASALAVGGAANRETDMAPAIASGPDPAGYWGFAVGLYPREAARRGFPFPPEMAEIQATGATHVLLPVSWAQVDASAVDLAPDDDTVSDATLGDVIERAHQAGLRVILLPLVELSRGGRGDWRGVLRPRDRAAWWRSYSRFVLHYARLARATGVAMLVIGSELSSLSGPRDSAYWSELARAVRAVYPGPLAYGANHDALDLRAPFPHVDVVGVSAYFSLGRRGPRSAEAFARRWRAIGSRLARLRREIGKPLIFLEAGYPSVVGGAARPWDYTTSAPIDLEEQRAAYAAMADLALGADWLDGVLLWTWFGPGGVHDRWYTPRGKPAMAEARRLLERRTAPARAGPGVSPGRPTPPARLTDPGPLRPTSARTSGRSNLAPPRTENAGRRPARPGT